MGVAKVGKSGGSGGALNYVLKEKHARIIGGNVAGTKEEIREQFAAFEDSRSSLKKNTTHITWSFAPGERVSDEKAVQLAEELLKKLKFEKTPYLIVRHIDKEKRETDPYEHLHIVAGRIRTNASVVPDFQMARRTIEAVKELELEHGLQQTPFIDRSAEKQPKRAELKMIERTGKLSARLVLQEQIKEVAAEFPEARAFVEELERRGVAIEFNIQKTGRIAGVSFETGGVAFKGSSLGKSYSWTGLQKQQGLDYEHKRDFDACQRASQRSGARRLERTAQNRIDVGDNGKRAAQDRVGKTRNDFDKAREANHSETAATANRAVEWSERDLGAAIGGSADKLSNVEPNSDQLRSGEQQLSREAGAERVEQSYAQDRFERGAADRSKLESTNRELRSGARKLDDGSLGRVEDGGRGTDSVIAGGHRVDRDFDRAGNQELDLDTGAAHTANSICEDTGRVPTDAEFGDQTAAERIGDKTQQKARAVIQSINLAYGGSLPSDVQEQMTQQLTEHPQLNDYYERSRLMRWREMIEMSQKFVEATARSVAATTPLPQPPMTEQERNERLTGWMQATVQVAVYEQTGREVDKEYVTEFGKRLAAGHEQLASEKGIKGLEGLAEKHGVAPPLVETQTELRAAVMMNVKSEEIAAPVLTREREMVQERAEKAQALEEAKQAREEQQQTRERGGYGMSR